MKNLRFKVVTPPKVQLNERQAAIWAMATQVDTAFKQKIYKNPFIDLYKECEDKSIFLCAIAILIPRTTSFARLVEMLKHDELPYLFRHIVAAMVWKDVTKIIPTRREAIEKYLQYPRAWTDDLELLVRMFLAYDELDPKVINPMIAQDALRMVLDYRKTYVTMDIVDKIKLEDSGYEESISNLLKVLEK